MRVVYSLGSNLGDRQAALRGAIAALAAGDLRLVAVSPVYETEPWGVVGHPDYLNVVAVFDAPVDADAWLVWTPGQRGISAASGAGGGGHVGCRGHGSRLAPDRAGPQCCASPLHHDKPHTTPPRAWVALGNHGVCLWTTAGPTLDPATRGSGRRRVSVLQVASTMPIGAVVARDRA